MTADPDYLSALGDVFATLSGPHVEKKKATILAIVDAKLSGQPIERVFERADTCTRTIWHTKWKHDPAIGGLVETIYTAASRWRDDKGLRAMLLAQERLALASPLAVTRILERLGSDDEAIILRAAFGILDRAGLETASKSSSKVDVDIDVRSLSDDELQAIVGGTGGG